MMNHRQRMLAALGHREPDRVPRYASLTPGVLDALAACAPGADPAALWGWDVAAVALRPPEPRPDLLARFGRYHAHRAVEWRLDWALNDYPPEWGVATRPAHLYHLSAPLPPLEQARDQSDLAAYPFPDYIGEWQHAHLEGEVAALHAAGWFVDAFVGWIFQTAWSLRGEVRLFEDMYDRPAFAAALLDRITGIRCAQAERLAAAGVDSLSLNDDIGGQRGMILSPAMWRRWLKPRLAEVIAAARRANPQVHFRYHSDGNYAAVIPDLIAIGVTSLRTVQPEALDVYAIKREYGRDVALEGTIGLQGVLREGPPEAVRAMVQQQCGGLMAGGGWVAAPGNGVTPDIPVANLYALFAALDAYGAYESEAIARR